MIQGTQSLSVGLSGADGSAVDYDANLKTLADQKIDDGKVQLVTNQFNELGVNIDSKSVVNILACPVGSPVDCIKEFAETLEDDKKQKILDKTSYFESLCGKGTSSSQSGTSTPEQDTPPTKTEAGTTPSTDTTPPAQPEVKTPAEQGQNNGTTDSTPGTDDVTPPAQQVQTGTSDSNPDDYTLPPAEQTPTNSSYTLPSGTPPAIVTLTAPPALQKEPEKGTPVAPPTCTGGGGVGGNKNNGTDTSGTKDDGSSSGNSNTDSVPEEPESPATTGTSNTDSVPEEPEIPGTSGTGTVDSQGSGNTTDDNPESTGSGTSGDQEEGNSGEEKGDDKKGDDKKGDDKKDDKDMPKKKPDLPDNRNNNASSHVSISWTLGALSVVAFLALF